MKTFGVKISMYFYFLSIVTVLNWLVCCVCVNED